MRSRENQWQSSAGQFCARMSPGRLARGRPGALRGWRTEYPVTAGAMHRSGSHLLEGLDGVADGRSSWPLEERPRQAAARRVPVAPLPVTGLARRRPPGGRARAAGPPVQPPGRSGPRIDDRALIITVGCRPSQLPTAE